MPGLALTTAFFTDRSMVASRGDQTAINSGHILYLINGRPTREVLEGGIFSDLLESFPVTSWTALKRSWDPVPSCTARMPTRPS